jgi:ankyrin repeat protein
MRKSAKCVARGDDEVLVWSGFQVSVQVDMQVKGSPLHVTAFHGHEAATRLLLAAGADVNAKAENGGTPLHHAAFFGRGSGL